MLGKLIKHEFRSTGRGILLLVCLLAVITPLTALYIRAYNSHFLSNNVYLFSMFRNMAVILYVLTVIGCFVATTFILMYRFYKSMVSKEAYLTHTLPVKKSALVFSKILVASIWHIVTVIVCILSVGIFTRILDLWKFSQLGEAIKQTMMYLVKGNGSISVLILLIIAVITQVLTSYAQIFFAFSIGQRVNGHPILGTVGTYIIYGIVVQIVVSIISAVGMLIYDTEFVHNIIANMSMVSILNTFICLAMLFNCAIFVVTYLVSVYMFNKKLNI